MLVVKTASSLVWKCMEDVLVEESDRRYEVLCIQTEGEGACSFALFNFSTNPNLKSNPNGGGGRLH